MPQTFDTIVIGAGVIGLASAYHLSKRKQKVLVVDKQYPGFGSTSRCIGGIRQQFSTEGSIKLMQESAGQFRKMTEELGVGIEYFEGGYLFLAHDQERMQAYASILPLQKRLGLNVRLVSVRECLEIVPPLNAEGLLGGVYSPEDGQAYPFKVLEGYIKQIKKNGSEVRTYCEVADIIKENGRVKGIKTRAGDAVYSGAILNATGPWAKELAGMAGLDLPIFPEEHEALITDRLPHLFDTMIVDYRKEGCYFYQRTNGQIIGCYTPVPNKPGIHHESSREFLLEMSRRSQRLIPEFKNARILRHWGGCYSLTPDGSPIIDQTEVKGFYVANGMCGHGFMFAPGIGKFITQIMLDGSYPFDWSEFKMDRDFSKKELLK